MKIFLLGQHNRNSGPSNVNRSLIRYCDSDLIYSNDNNKIRAYFDNYINSKICNKIIISGGCSSLNYKIVIRSHKPYYYLMHGLYQYENIVNHLCIPQEDLETEKKILQGSRKIICVSKLYSQWVSDRFPQYSDKILYVNNGITLLRRKKKMKKPYSVAVSGGNRCIKNNGEVYKAIKHLNKLGIPAKLYVFGRKYPDNDFFDDQNCVQYFGQLNKEEYYSKLDEINCFVINSEIEPFGLVVQDALNCNCSLIMSKNVGCKDILKYQDQDIIQDPHDILEVSSKIFNSLKNSNTDRLYESVDLEKCSEKNAYYNLKNIVEKDE